MQNFFKDAGGDPVIAKETLWPAGVTQATVRMKWEKDRITWDLFEGPNTSGAVIAHAGLAGVPAASRLILTARR